MWGRRIGLLIMKLESLCRNKAILGITQSIRIIIRILIIIRIRIPITFNNHNL